MRQGRLVSCETLFAGTSGQGQISDLDVNEKRGWIQCCGLPEEFVSFHEVWFFRVNFRQPFVIAVLGELGTSNVPRKTIKLPNLATGVAAYPRTDAFPYIANQQR